MPWALVIIHSDQNYPDMTDPAHNDELFAMH